MLKTLIGTALFALASIGFATESSEYKLSEDVTASNATLVCSNKSDGKLLCKPLESGDVELTTKNTIVLRGPIVAESSSAFVKKFHELEHLDEVQKIYVYVKSPGGSIFAGDYIANIMASSKKEVVAIVDFAASMAFHVSHFADKRLILPTGTMMQHHASGGTGSGEFPNVEKQWNWIKKKVALMNNKDSAACLQTNYDQFMKNIDRDWWLLADEAVSSGCVDGVASIVTCSKDLSNKVESEFVSFLGMRFEIQWSGCPLELYPRKIKVRNAGRLGLSKAQRIAADEYIMLLTDPLQYYNTRGSFKLDRYFMVDETKIGPAEEK